MSRLFPTNSAECVPLVIVDGDSHSGSRLGGLPPLGITPGHVTPLTSYFFTIRIADEPGLEVSVFLSLDFDRMADGAGIIHTSGELFEVVTHGRSVRTAVSALISELTPHPLQHGIPCKDVIDDDDTQIVRPHHKLGGYPSIQETGEGLPAAVAQAYEHGFFQVLQIDFPGSGDGDVDGDWPFAGGTFHLLGSEPLDRCTWLGFWEY